MNDLISRQTAVNELIAMREHIDARMSVVGGTAYEMAIEALREPERKKGHWILSDDREWYTCSECGAEVDVSMGFGIFVNDDAVREMRFCPNCGADMRGENDE